MIQQLKIEGEQFFDEYILVAPGSDYGRAMWSDIEKLPNGVILENALKHCARIIEIAHHAHFSFAINRKVQLPFQNIWKHLYSLEKVKFDANKKYCVIYTDVSAARTDRKYLSELQERNNITMILVMVNTMARRDSLIEKRRAYFDQIYSFDRKDCEKYGFIYHPTNYSMADLSMDSIDQDAFYVGVSKGRADIIGKVFKKFQAEGANAFFYISGLEFGEKKIEGIHYNQWLDYGQILKYIQHSNCIVEIMDGKQEGVTLRTMEAICYNRKLLTNNQSMKESKYYKTGNVQVFKNPDDIDVDFIMRKEKVDYNYEGEFSPIHLLEHINQVKLEKQ